jgi:hypothetical protein
MSKIIETSKELQATVAKVAEKLVNLDNDTRLATKAREQAWDEYEALLKKTPALKKARDRVLKADETLSALSKSRLGLEDEISAAASPEVGPGAKTVFRTDALSITVLVPVTTTVYSAEKARKAWPADVLVNLATLHITKKNVEAAVLCGTLTAEQAKQALGEGEDAA